MTQQVESKCPKHAEGHQFIQWTNIIDTEHEAGKVWRRWKCACGAHTLKPD